MAQKVNLSLIVAARDPFLNHTTISQVADVRLSFGSRNLPHLGSQRPCCTTGSNGPSLSLTWRCDVRQVLA